MADILQQVAQQAEAAQATHKAVSEIPPHPPKQAPLVNTAPAQEGSPPAAPPPPVAASVPKQDPCVPSQTASPPPALAPPAPLLPPPPEPPKLGA